MILLESVGASLNLFNKLKASYSRLERLIHVLESHRTHATTLNKKQIRRFDQQTVLSCFEIESEI